jgi:hypothetical protein
MISSALTEGMVILTAGPEGKKTGVGVRVAKTAVAVGRRVAVGFGVRVGGRTAVLVLSGVGKAAVGSRVGTSVGWQPVRICVVIIKSKKIIVFLIVSSR